MESESESCTVTLGEQQERAVALIKQNKNLFLTGCAGTGKSAVIEHIRNSPTWNPETHRITASTGVAALLVGRGEGSTLHSFLGWDFKETNVRRCVEEIKRKTNKYKELCSVRLLIIDEISMIQSQYFYTAGEVLKQVRGNTRPWGGIQLVVVGDFFQLPPVKDPHKLFNTEAWKSCDFTVCILEKVYRQASDMEYCDLLRRVRNGSPTDSDIALLTSRTIQPPPGDVQPTIIVTHKRECDAINRQHFDALPDAPTFFPTIAGCSTPHDPESTTYLEKACERLADDARLPTPDVVCLKRGCQIMLTVNWEGRANGSRGVVTGFTALTDTDLPVMKVKPERFKKCQINLEHIPIEARPPMYPIIRWADGGTSVVTEYLWSRTLRSSPHRYRIWVTGVPLLHAFSTTIHKSQGATLECCHINMQRNCFSPGQLYVALSRVKSLDSLYITMDMHQRSIRDSLITDPEVKQYLTSVRLSELR